MAATSRRGDVGVDVFQAGEPQPPSNAVEK